MNLKQNKSNMNHVYINTYFFVGIILEFIALGFFQTVVDLFLYFFCITGLYILDFRNCIMHYHEVLYLFVLIIIQFFLFIFYCIINTFYFY